MHENVKSIQNNVTEQDTINTNENTIRSESKSRQSSQMESSPSQFTTKRSREEITDDSQKTKRRFTVESLEAEVVRLSTKDLLRGGLDEPAPPVSNDNDRHDSEDITNDAEHEHFDSWVSSDGQYEVRNGETFRKVHTHSGPQEKRIANFAARIVEEIALDDGTETTRNYVIEGRLHNGRTLPKTRVPVSKFHGMQWLSEAYGFGPSLAAGQGNKDHMRCAVEAFSGSTVARNTVFTHFGWTNSEQGQLLYLHADGAIGASNICVDVDQEFSAYKLPREYTDPVEAMRLSVSLLEIGEPETVYPLWASVWRAPTCEWLLPTFVLWLDGPSGTLKSTTSALALSHFGGPFRADTLPASWLDTENRLEQKLHLAKDTLIVVDDFCPEKHAGLAGELERRASRIIRSVGNRQARGRLRSDLTARKAYVPRGIVISTGEQLPNLAPSALARIFPVPFEKNSIDMSKLSKLQCQADKLPYAMAGYLDYLRGYAAELHLVKRFQKLRAQAETEGHNRLPETVAHLYIGLELGIGYARTIEAIDNERAKTILRIGWETFIRLAREHGKALVNERPSRVFIETIHEGLASGRCWLANRQSGVRQIGNELGEKVGWADEQGIYLLFRTAYAFVNQRLQHRGGLAIRENALKKMLHEGGFVQQREDGRLDTKVRCEGVSTRVLMLSRELFDEDKSLQE